MKSRIQTDLAPVEIPRWLIDRGADGELYMSADKFRVRLFGAAHGAIGPPLFSLLQIFKGMTNNGRRLYSAASLWSQVD